MGEIEEGRKRYDTFAQEMKKDRDRADATVSSILAKKARIKTEETMRREAESHAGRRELYIAEYIDRLKWTAAASVSLIKIIARCRRNTAKHWRWCWRL